MNQWMSLYNAKKVFRIGDLVFWDHLVLSQAQLREAIDEYGAQRFQVLSLPYDAVSDGVVYGERVNIGRQGVYVTRTNPRYLLKVTP